MQKHHNSQPVDPALPKLCKREWGPQWILSRKEVPKRFHYWHLLAKLVACLTLDSRPLPPSVNKRLQFDKRKTSPAWVELDFQEASNESTLTNLEMKVGPISTPTGVRVHNSIGDHCHQMMFTSVNVAFFQAIWKILDIITAALQANATSVHFKLESKENMSSTRPRELQVELSNWKQWQITF